MKNLLYWVTTLLLFAGFLGNVKASVKTSDPALAAGDGGGKITRNISPSPEPLESPIIKPCSK